MRQLLAAGAILLCTSCATMVNGRYQQVSVDSFPSGAAVTVDCGDVPHDAGKTPATLRLPRRAATCNIKLTKDSYQERIVVLERQLSRAVSANRVVAAPVAIVAGLFGLAIGDELDMPDEGASTGWAVGMELGSAPGRQIDKHTGGAYKWVPGDIFIILIRQEQPQ